MANCHHQEQEEKQEKIHALLSAHLRLERVKGREINPAARQQSFSKTGQEDDDCKSYFDFLV
jgi:hypothetical protein